MQMIQVHPLQSTENENSKSKFVCICALYNKFMGGMDLLDYLIALYSTKIYPMHGIIASYSTSTTSASCRHGCFTLTEEIPEELDGVSAKEQMAPYDFKLQIAEYTVTLGFCIQTAKT